MRSSDWSSDVCSSDLRIHAEQVAGEDRGLVAAGAGAHFQVQVAVVARVLGQKLRHQFGFELAQARAGAGDFLLGQFAPPRVRRSEERRLGKEWCSSFRSRWSACHETKKKKRHT